MLIHVQSFWNVHCRRNAATSRKKTFFHFGFVLFCSVSYRFVQGISTTVRAMPRQWNGMRSSSQICLVRKKRREGKTRKKEKKKKNEKKDKRRWWCTCLLYQQINCGLLLSPAILICSLLLRMRRIYVAIVKPSFEWMECTEHNLITRVSTF